MSEYKIVEISTSFNGAKLEKHGKAMLLHVENYIMKLAVAHKVTRNIPNFNSRVLRGLDFLLRFSSRKNED